MIKIIAMERFPKNERRVWLTLENVLWEKEKYQ